MNTFQAFFLVLYATLIEKIALVLAFGAIALYMTFIQKTKKLNENDWVKAFEKLDVQTSYKKFILLFGISFSALAFALYSSLVAMELAFPLAYTACASSFSCTYLFCRRGVFKSAFSDYFVEWKADTLSKAAQ